MPSFVNETKVIAAPWWAKDESGSPLETCTIRKFAYGDRQYLAGETVRVGIKVGGGAAHLQDAQSRSKNERLNERHGEKPANGQHGEKATVLVGRMNLAILERGIVSWTDPQGQKVPVTADGIAQLDSKDADFILAEINAYNPRQRRSEEDQEKFRD
jgi:hypothetical protein